MQCRKPGFDPWVGKIPWRRESLPIPVFWPGEFHGLYSPWGHKELDTTKQLSPSLSGPAPVKFCKKKTYTLEPSLDSALSRSFISSRGLQGKNEHIAHGNSENRALNYWHAVSIVLIHYSMYFSKTFMVNNITTLCTYCLLPSLSIPKEAFFLFFFPIFLNFLRGWLSFCVFCPAHRAHCPGHIWLYEAMNNLALKN